MKVGLVVTVLLVLLSVFSVRYVEAYPSTIYDCSWDVLLSVLNSSTVDYIEFENCSLTGSTILFQSEIRITRNLTINGALNYGQQVTFSGRNQNRLFVVARGCILTLGNLVIQNGYANSISGLDSNGGAIFVSDSAALRLNTVSFFRNSAPAAGGAIYTSANADFLEIRNSLFQANIVQNGAGGAIDAEYQTSSVIIINTLFLNNAANGTAGDGGFGGAIKLHETRATLDTCQFHGNSAGACGGGIYNLLSDLTMINCVVSSSITTGAASGSMGAGLCIDGALSTDKTVPGLKDGGYILLQNSSFEDNLSAEKGGGVYVCLYSPSGSPANHNDRMRIVQSRFCQNNVLSTSGPWGAAIQYDCGGTLTFEDGPSLFGGNKTPANGTTLETFFPSGGTTVNVNDNSIIPGYTTGVTSPGAACAAIYDGKVGPNVTFVGGSSYSYPTGSACALSSVVAQMLKFISQ